MERRGWANPKHAGSQGVNRWQRERLNAPTPSGVIPERVGHRYPTAAPVPPARRVRMQNPTDAGEFLADEEVRHRGR